MGSGDSAVDAEQNIVDNRGKGKTVKNLVCAIPHLNE